MSTLKTVSRIRFIIALVALLAGPIASGSSAVAQDDITGIWEGVIEIPGTKLEIIVEFTLGDDGIYAGTIDIPLQDLQGMDMTDVVVNLPEVLFAMPGVPGEPKFVGALSVDKSEISGQFTQGGQTFPFSLIQ